MKIMTEEEKKAAENKAANEKVVSDKPAEKSEKAAENKAANEAGDGNIFGNKDKKKEFPFPKTWATGVVVRQSQNIPGRKEEASETVKLMPYSPDIFETVERTGGFKGFNILIINDPR